MSVKEQSSIQICLKESHPVHNLWREREGLEDTEQIWALQSVKDFRLIKGKEAAREA